LLIASVFYPGITAFSQAGAVPDPGFDDPGDVTGTLILRDDCWGAACVDTGGFGPMPIGGGTGDIWTYTGGRVWFVLKVIGGGPGSDQTVEFDNASVGGAIPAVSDWMLY
jgi:hypothetical protein